MRVSVWEEMLSFMLSGFFNFFLNAGCSSILCQRRCICALSCLSDGYSPVGLFSTSAATCAVTQDWKACVTLLGGLVFGFLKHQPFFSLPLLTWLTEKNVKNSLGDTASSKRVYVTVTGVGGGLIKIPPSAPAVVLSVLAYILPKALKSITFWNLVYLEYGTIASWKAEGSFGLSWKKLKSYQRFSVWGLRGFCKHCVSS